MQIHLCCFQQFVAPALAFAPLGIPAISFWIYVAALLIFIIGLVKIFGELPQEHGLDKILPFGRLFYAIPLAVFGSEHFTATANVASLVPRWIPAHTFWVYLVGIAFLCAALSIAVLVQARLAAALVGMTMLVFVLVMSWRNKLPNGHALGVSCHECFGTGVACAVDVSIENKRPKIHRATVAVDCGLAVNPLSVESQFQAGLSFGLTQLMAKGAITLKNGRVEQRNFDGYVLPYIIDAPVEVDVHIVKSAEAPTGCGEPPVPVISPAVVNAVTRLTGKRYRTLPLVTV